MCHTVIVVIFEELYVNFKKKGNQHSIWDSLHSSRTIKMQQFVECAWMSWLEKPFDQMKTFARRLVLKQREITTRKYSHLSPCGHPAITDIRYITDKIQIPSIEVSLEMTLAIPDTKPCSEGVRYDESWL